MHYNDVIPQMSENFRYSYDIFNLQFNEISFFVEDEYKEESYLCILRKLFPNIKFEHIYPLGGKNNVIEHASITVNENNKRSIYIVDKDFDDILGTKKNNMENLFYLKKYCIENYLITEEAITRYLVSSKPSINRKHIKEKIDLDLLFTKTLNNLKEIIYIYILVQKYVNSKINNINKNNSLDTNDNGISLIPTISISIEKFIDCSCFNLKQEQLDSYIDEIKRKIAECNMEESYECIYNDLCNKLQINSVLELSDDHICGKTQLKVIFKHLKGIFDFLNSCKFECFVHLLCEFNEFDNLRYLRDDINRYLNS